MYYFPLPDLPDGLASRCHVACTKIPHHQPSLYFRSLDLTTTEIIGKEGIKKYIKIYELKIHFMLKMRSDFPPTIMIPILLALNKHLHLKNHNGRLGIKNILRSMSKNIRSILQHLLYIVIPSLSLNNNDTQVDYSA